MPKPLLKIQSLTIEVDHAKRLIDNVNFEIPEECIVALVGESGSGKTTTALSILRLLPVGLKTVKGSIFFEGRDILKNTEEQMRQLRGKNIGMVFQEPLSAFNPLFKIGYQIEEVLAEHTSLTAKDRRIYLNELLKKVEIPDPQRILSSYPHQLSGGLRQRSMIAQAIAASPKLIIADEPTSNLDVTIQAKIMELFRRLKKELKLSILLITHDLGVVRHLADFVVVMKQGKVIEMGITEDILAHPQEDYTKELIDVC